MAPKKNIDMRMVYILPSLLALVLALTCFIFQFGNEFMDMRNTCYTIYTGIPEGMTAEEIPEEFGRFLLGYDLTGYTLNENTQGATILDGELLVGVSFKIELMNISKKTAYQVAEDLHSRYGIPVMVEASVVKITYVD